jgi:hypothetical protein
MTQIDRARYLTMKEAAERSQYDYDHIRRLVKTGAVAYIEISERIRLVDWEDLQRYITAKPQRGSYRGKKEKSESEPGQ